MTKLRSREMDAFAASIYGDRKIRTRAERWRSWKRTGLPVAAAILVVVVIAVVTDVPTHQSLAGERSEAQSLITEVNNDLKPCAFSIKEANTIFREWQAGTLDASDRGRVPSLLSDDATACSFASDNVNDLAGIEEPGTGAGKYLSLVVGISLTWTTSDALGAIEDMSVLTSNAHSHSAASDLLRRNKMLAGDRRDALVAMSDADRYLKGTLSSLQMPAVRLPAT